MYSATFALTAILGIALTNLFLGFAFAVLIGADREACPTSKTPSRFDIFRRSCCSLSRDERRG